MTLWNLNLSVVISQNNNHLPNTWWTHLTSHKPKANTKISCFLCKCLILYHCRQSHHLITTYKGRFMNRCSMKKCFGSSRYAINWIFSKILKEKIKTRGNISLAMLNMYEILQLFCLMLKTYHRILENLT